jgi:purine nucleoside permease
MSRYQYPAAQMAPSVRACDGATSDVYYSGSILADGFEAFMTLLTNGSSIYCTTAQEDNAILESFMRGAKAGILDYSRIILMRTAANFDREHPGETVTDHFFYDVAGGFLPSLLNIYNVGIKIVQDIVFENWDAVYLTGITAENYVGDIFGTLGGVPDFGPYPYFGEA